MRQRTGFQPHRTACKFYLLLLTLAGLVWAGQGTSAEISFFRASALRTDQHGDALPDGVFYRLGTSRLRHWGIKTLPFSADGKHVLSQGDSHLRVWDCATGLQVRQSADSAHYNCLV